MECPQRCPERRRGNGARGKVRGDGNEDDDVDDGTDVVFVPRAGRTKPCRTFHTGPHVAEARRPRLPRKPSGKGEYSAEAATVVVAVTEHTFAHTFARRIEKRRAPYSTAVTASPGNRCGGRSAPTLRRVGGGKHLPTGRFSVLCVAVFDRSTQWYARRSRRWQ